MWCFHTLRKCLCIFLNLSPTHRPPSPLRQSWFKVFMVGLTVVSTSKCASFVKFFFDNLVKSSWKVSWGFVKEQVDKARTNLAGKVHTHIWHECMYIYKTYPQKVSKLLEFFFKMDISGDFHLKIGAFYDYRSHFIQVAGILNVRIPDFLKVWSKK